MKSKLILIFTCFVFLNSFQQFSVNDLFGRNKNPESIDMILPLKDYQNDFNQMFQTVIKKHPQPYAFISEDSLRELANRQYKKITDTTTIWEFQWICRSVVSAIKCGHTGVWSESSIPKSKIFPLNVRYVGSKLYIIDTWGNSEYVSVGEEILSINGVSVGDLRNEIYLHLYSDGYNDTRNYEVMNLNFYWLIPTYFEFPSSYSITIKQKGNIKRVMLTEAIKPHLKKTFLDDCEDKLCLDINLDSKTAIITIRSFAYYKKDLPIFKSFIDSCFNQIKENKIEDLIIDLRNNEGGDPFCGSYLVQYITDKPYTYFDKDNFMYRDLKKPIKPNPNAFNKKPYILTNGLCFSTTGHFCSIIKENNLGIFVGDETGGTYTCNDFGKIYPLKNTKLLLRTARKICKTTATKLTNEHGIIPDHYVYPTIDNIINNNDTVLNYTLKLIEEK